MKISELTERYGVSRQAFYNRLEAIGLSLSKDERGRISASQEQVQILDELEEHLKQGGNLSNFSSADIPVDSTPIEMEAQIDSAIVPAQSAQIQQHYEEETLLESLIGAIASSIQPRSPLWQYRELQEAAEKGWILDSAKVTALIGVKPRGDFFERGGWQFYRVGRIGRSSAWRVSQKLYSK